MQSFVDEYYIQKIFYAIKNNTHHDQFGRFASSGFNGFSLREKGKYLTEHGGDTWRDVLTNNEDEAIRKYTGSHYDVMNERLRSKEYNPKHSDEIDKLITDATSGLMKSTSPIDMKVLRHVDSTMFDAFTANVGKHFVDRGFCSMTLDDTPIPGKLQMHIVIPKGTPGAYVAPLSRNRDDEEWLVPPNAKFKVQRTYKSTDGSPIVDLEMVGIHDWGKA
jgi:hypothetical protein